MATGFAGRRPDWQLPQLQREDLHLDSDKVLEDNVARQQCPKCQRSRSLFCYDCLVAFTPLPRVTLPFKLSIILHHAEPRTKATGVTLALLAPDHVNICSIDQCDEFDKERAAVMFPGEDAEEPQNLDMAALERVFVIEASWQKAKQLSHHPALQGVRQVKLPKGSARTAFWRYHTDGVADEGVCTAEAVHCFMRLLLAAGKLPHAPFNNDPHYFDNLLYYFAFQHKRIQEVKAACKQPEVQLKKRQSEHRSKQQPRPQQQPQQQQQHVGVTAVPGAKADEQRQQESPTSQGEHPMHINVQEADPETSQSAQRQQSEQHEHRHGSLNQQQQQEQEEEEGTGLRRARVTSSGDEEQGRFPSDAERHPAMKRHKACNIAA